MKLIYLSLFIILFICSCAGYRTTQFTANSIHLGVHKEAVIKKFGIPFKTDSYIDDKIMVETIYYKEAVDVSSYTYILTSILIFEDSILTKIEQKEEFIPDVSNIKTQSP